MNDLTDTIRKNMASLISFTIDTNEPNVDEMKEDLEEEDANTEAAVEVAINEVDKPLDSQEVDSKTELDESTESPKDDPNENSSVLLLGAARKNRTLEMKLSAIIEKACSSDLESEDLPEAEPPSEAVHHQPDDQEAAGSDRIRGPATELEAAPRKRAKKYVYRLKSKSGGRMLTYTSTTPIVLMKPQICLTRIRVETNGVLTGSDSFTDEVDSDVSSAKAKRRRANSFVNGKRKKGRPSVYEKKIEKLSVLNDLKSPDADAKAGGSNSSFGMQTRKRKLKFTPDGRLVSAGKRHKGSSTEEISDDDGGPPAKDSSDDEWRATDDDLQKFSYTGRRLPERRMADRAAKSEALRKVATPKAATTPKIAPKTTPKVTPAPNNVAAEILDKLNGVSPASPAPSSPKSAVAPAQLFSKLLGIPILPSQLRIEYFKPKNLQQRPVAAPKTLRLGDITSNAFAQKSKASPEKSKAPVEKSKAPAAKVPPKAKTPTPALRRSARTSLQKLLPEFEPTYDTTPYKTANTNATPAAPTVSSRRRNPIVSTPSGGSDAEPVHEPIAEVPNFDDFTDSRTVRTKAGPKKVLLAKQRLEPEEAEQLSHTTVYNLVQNVFERLPSWNLHIIPDTNTFCIAQVGRGRMGIPILRKSIELNKDFAAKIFVHQLHCKKYDGVYDTESKINSLIGEIDALAA